ncbi:hypothetical protein [Tsukamurella pseudospumae]|uniref:Uncharacterized protein n=1 Tax=Tsukamurella pseudospumae TaxID=239498 RepID=A0A137ZZ71_9ACTN|nr:hypothetical protein [Tsukamurella pseudospumae]KXP03439.1 hypothetical protein AXK60_16580 [Tsukamurella pseudospumae]
MSEERRISLAELLAREGGAPAASGGRRRRHRGGENSVTVAELTGEIPVVRDDEPAPQAAETPQAVQSDGAPQDAESHAVDAQVVEEVHAAPAQVVEEPAEPEPEPAAEAAQSEDEPITSSFLAAAVGEARAEEAPAEPAAQDLADGVEGVDVVHHTDEGHAEENFAWSRWDQAEAPIMATADFNTAQVRERQARFAEIETDDTVDVAPVTDVPESADGEGAAPSVPDTGRMSVEQIDEARAALGAEGTSDFLAKSTDHEDDAEKATSTGAGRGWLVLAAEVVLGIAAGAGLFFGFFKLWNWGGGMPTIALTVVLAFIVIIGIVTFTHFLRKTTDYLTLGLALLVGLVITFGPLLMALGAN